MVGLSIPVGSGTALGVVPAGTLTNSARQAPRPGTTLEFCWHAAATHVPARRTWAALAQARHWLGPAPEQLEQLASQVMHDDDVASKNCVLLHVGRQRPLVRTGREGGQDEHWLKEAPEQEAQSAWQLRQEPVAEKVFPGQVATHLPDAASWLEAQVRQNVDNPVHVAQEESHAVQVKLSCGDTNVPDGQLATHFPAERKKPGTQPVHCSWFTVEMELKLGILHEVHFEPQLSHSSLLLSAIKDDPEHTPLASVETQAPLSRYVPWAHSMQSLEVPALQVLHDAEHGVQLAPLANAPDGHNVPDEVVLFGASHLVRSFASRVKPVLQAVQTPVPSVHAVHPIWQMEQSPVDVRKKPGAHWLHAVPFAAVVNPVVQVQLPFAPQTPLTQLHDAGALAGVETRHRPLPVGPSSHLLQFAGHAAHPGPKNPAAHVSHDTPVKPAAQVHVPAAVQIPDDAHGGEHAADSMSNRVSVLGALVGSCAVSGMESQTMTRAFPGAGELMEIQTLEERARERRVNGVDELAPMGLEGIAVKAGWPEYKGPT